MIEIAPKSYKMKKDEAVLYCQFCNHNGRTDWRLPTFQEWVSYKSISGWYADRIINLYIGQVDEHPVCPVRDI
jgi:hypothetical protein